MKRVLQFICILLFSSILFSSVSSTKVYSSTNKITVTVGSNYSDRSNEVKIPINLSDMPDNGLAGMNFSLQFDDGLTFNSITNGELISNSSDFSYSIKDNKISFLYSDTTGGDTPLKNAGLLCYISFTVNNNSYKTSYSIKRIATNSEKFIDKYFSNVEPTFVDGAVAFKDSLYRVSSYKKWQITFNSEISPSSLINNSIEVKNLKGEAITCSFSITNGGKTLEITAPSGGYKLYDSYTITLKNTFISNKSRKLSKEQIINFYVER
jgi:hypothetical protein